MGEAYIVKARRTAGGRKGGRLRAWHPADLAARVLDDLVEGFDPAIVEDVVMGCVSQFAEQSTNVARNAVLSSSLPQSVPGTTVDRQCGSSQQALHFAAATVMAGAMDVVIAAGVESMTRVPMGLPYKLARDAGVGTYKSPGMERRYPGIVFSQFTGAEMMAVKYDLSKDALDEFGYQSQVKAAAAARAGAFDAEILPVEGLDAEGNAVEHRVDEGIRFDASLAATKAVKLLSPDGRLTAATSSQICDGASGVLVANERGLKRLGAEPIARIHHMTVVGEDPVIMLEAPINATRLALKRAGMRIDDIDLFEVNEAFASVPLAWLKETGADPARLNVNGGAIALGHPLGASGTKLMATLVHALRARGLRWGLQTMCEGGGLANVTIVEAL
ncbi:MAG: acetyl-CoA C-acetyltransferase [Sphingomonadaceae bacterium]|uniref:acetyl-CoA C-acetyltransferase n=1 Tax=Thermaurantiacus sp. TaxID=2820283 RepID=UPI00298EDB56|nr:acetyl-CoA C-acetyltransferase [Thermaurantiacus sp.]MCS6987427.1 acetyl-CoA C-acetyltransferase [Sphingomonadaceae bacterium]MDW8415347.1 acetyl-CoA C-acetyltransferase [Thermaurantiacus sp.]